MHILKLPRFGSTSALTLLMVIGFFLIHLSGDHVFNKTNNLKLALTLLVLSFAIPLYCFHSRNSGKNASLLLFVILLLPVLATVPGFIISGGGYVYLDGAILEWLTKTFAAGWCVVCICLFNNERRILGFLNRISITIVFTCLIAFMQLAGWQPLLRLHLNPFEVWCLGVEPFYQGSTIRPTSTFGNPNYFAAFLAMLLPLASALCLCYIDKSTRQLKYAAYWCFCIVLMVTALFFTKTRAAIFAAMVAQVLFIVLYCRYFKRISLWCIAAYIATGLACTILLLYFVFPDLLDRFSRLSQQSAWVGRTAAWLVAWESIKAAPWFGYGAGASYLLFFEFVDPNWSLYNGERSYDHVHNEWLEVAQEGGLFGWLVYLIFWCGIVYLGLKGAANEVLKKPSRILLLAAVSGLIAFQVHGLFSVAQRMLTTQLLAGLLMAVILGLYFGKRGISVTNLKLGCRILNLILFFRSVKGSIRIVGPLAAIFSVSIAWFLLVPILQHNKAYVEALNQAEKSPQALYALGREGENIYGMNKSLEHMKKNADSQYMFEVASNLSSLFPHYRNVDDYLALAVYKQGRISEAQALALLAQQRDIYHIDTQVLLSQIALKTGQIELFSQQLAGVLQYWACQERIVVCRSGQVSVDLAELPVASGLRLSVNTDHSLSVLLGPNLFESLFQFVQSNSSATEVEIRRFVLELGRKIGDQAFFQIVSALGEPLDLRPIELKKLGRLITVEKTINKIKHEAHALGSIDISGRSRRIYERQRREVDVKLSALITEQQELLEALDNRINTAQFLQRRQLLIKVTNWLNTTMILGLDR